MARLQEIDYINCYTGIEASYIQSNQVILFLLPLYQNLTITYASYFIPVYRDKMLITNTNKYI